jgi:methionyl-tRNA formyltransferase
MTKTSKTVVFFGSGPVAARSLELLAKNFSIEAVITKPRPAHHRGNTPVLDVADKLNLAVLTVTNKQELSALFSKKSLNSTLGVLIDFGIIVNQDVIDYFPLGIVNSHFSILPDLRGADPISFAILSGQKLTGVSLMLLVAAMDEGPLLAFGEQPLDGHETTPSLTDRLILLSDALLSDVLPKYINGDLQAAPQAVTKSQVSYSHKLAKTDGILDFRKPAVVLEREVRAFTGWPGSRTRLGNKEVTVMAAHVVNELLEPGQAVVKDKQLLIGTSEGSLAIDQLKPAGRPQMTATAFLAGNKL